VSTPWQTASTSWRRVAAQVVLLVEICREPSMEAFFGLQPFGVPFRGGQMAAILGRLERRYWAQEGDGWKAVVAASAVCCQRSACKVVDCVRLLHVRSGIAPASAVRRSRATKCTGWRCAEHDRPQDDAEERPLASVSPGLGLTVPGEGDGAVRSPLSGLPSPRGLGVLFWERRRPALDRTVTRRLEAGRAFPEGKRRGRPAAVSLPTVGWDLYMHPSRGRVNQDEDVRGAASTPIAPRG